MAVHADRQRQPQELTPQCAYRPGELEPRWQRKWAAADLFRTPTAGQEPSSYVFAGCPFTTGEAHMGHIRSYTISDTFVRFRRARGDAVLFSLGFDSFGLPAELEATKRGISPADWVRRCSARMRSQFERLGYSCDWERSFVSSDPIQYRWSQSLFLSLLERGLVYRRVAQVIWCDSCETVLAALQSEGDVCWRCATAVRFRRLPQWFLRVSAYITENEESLAGLPGWNRAALGSQRAILGRVDGYELEASILGTEALTVFMTRPQALADAEFVAVSPNHPQIDALAADPEVAKTLEEVRHAGWLREARASRRVVQTGLQASIAGIARPLPIAICPEVDNRFGPTAVLKGNDGPGRPAEPASGRAGLGAALENHETAAQLRPAARYRAQDFPISRQRSWGAPIPIVHCQSCGVVPVPREQLPVELPEDLQRTGAGNALESCESFVACQCPACGRAAARETDTLDCHVDALWMWMPICVPAKDRSTAMFGHPELQRWLPIRQIVWGADAGGYLFDQRITAKFLQDTGKLAPLEGREPFRSALMHEMIQMEGRKMSKHLGNVVNPSELVADAGADAVRLAVLAAASPARPFNWNGRPLASAQAFLHSLWRYAEPRLRQWPASGVSEHPPTDPLRVRLAMWCAVGLEKTAAAYEQLEMQRAMRNLTLLFDRVQEFERRALERRGDLEAADREAIASALLLLLQGIAPATPHIAEELWALAGNETMISARAWPIA
jgi:leucyl-tRNA synthetase